MKVFIKHHPSYAGKWIYEGYKRAWKQLGYDVVYFEHLEDIKEDGDHYIMTTDSSVTNHLSLGVLERSTKSFIFAQPNEFPKPWGMHPNFVCSLQEELIKEINKIDNAILWTFLDSTEYHKKWKTVHTVPLAFDSIGYTPEEKPSFKKYDVCFVGGWANNGFNEKQQIMKDTFSKFMKTDLKCGIFINKSLSHQDECNLLYNSKVALNIHDAYQRKLGLDTNERTFKSLGLNGLLVSDSISQLNNLFPEVPTSLDAQKLVDYIVEYVSYDHEKLRNIKEKNRAMIMQKHTYVKRVEELLKL